MTLHELLKSPLTFALLLAPVALFGCGDDGSPADSGAADTTGDGDPGDGDGDPGDGDGDPGDGDGDTGDGDGDPGDGDGDGDTGDGDGDTGDGDGDTGDGDGDGDGDCAAMDAINGPEECFNPRGWFWDGTACDQILCTCEGSDCNALYFDEASCLDAYAACSELPPECDPDQAVGIGPCDQFFGWAWDGSMCVAVNGCECEGPDCQSLPLELEDCQSAHADC